MNSLLVCSQGHPLSTPDESCRRCGPTPVSGEASTIIGPSDPGSTIDSVIPSLTVAGAPRIPGYEILASIRSGGMGQVFKARHVPLHRIVALKVPLSSDDQELRARFLLEAEAAARLRHPNICTIYDVGEHDGRPYLAMEHIDGENLSAWLDREKPNARQCAAMCATLARAVEAAHRERVIHRDLKPSNVMVRAQSGGPVLLDFGLAKIGDADRSELTHTGQILGTPAYMSPEQAAGEKAGPEADVYGLGAILYYLLCRQPPFPATDPVQVLQQVLKGDPKPPRSIHPALHADVETICLKAMAREPRMRYATAEGLAEDLERFASGEPIRGRREGILSRWRRKVQRNRAVAWTAAAAVTVALLASIAVVGMRQSTRRQAALETELTSREQSVSSWTVDAIARHDGLLVELERIAPDAGLVARQRFARTLVASGRERTQRSRLEADDEAYVRGLLPYLKAHSADEAGDLEQSLQDRLRSWEEVFRHEPFVAESSMLTPLGSPRNPEARALSQPSLGNTRVEARWDNWKGMAKVGVLLQCDPDAKRPGYSAILRVAPSPERPEPTSFADADEASLEIWRGDTRLRGIPVSMAKLAAAGLSLEVERVGDEISARVNERTSISFRDVFPLRPAGVFGILTAESVSVQSLRGWRQPLPARPSPLEVGDELFAAGRFPEARDQYERQRVALAGTEDAVAAEFKLGLVMEKLGDLAAAAEQFERAATQDGDRWPRLAQVHLWALRVRRQDFAGAEQVMTTLAGANRSSEATLAALAPQELRDSILTSYRSRTGSLTYLRADPDRVARAERIVEIEELWASPANARMWSQLELLRAYRWNGEVDRAVQRVQQWLAAVPDDEPDPGTMFAAEYAWMLREKGQPERALDEIDRRLYREPGVVRVPLVSLLIERARLHIAIGKPELAEGDLEEFLRLDPHGAARYRNLSDATLLLGLLRERRGDAAGAEEAWSRGLLRYDATDLRTVEYLGGVTGLINAIALGVLSGQMNEDGVETLLRGVTTRSATLSMVSQVGGQGLIRSGSRAMHAMWLTPEGKDLAWAMSCQSLSFPEYVRAPMRLLSVEFASTEFYHPPASEAQRQLVREFFDAGFGALLSGRLSAAQLPFLATAYKHGNVGTLGWGIASRSLDAELRGPIAYLLSFRLRKLGRPEGDVRMLLETALRDAPSDSLLRRLAQEELAASRGN